MPPSDEVRLRHMLDAAEAALSFAKGRTRTDLDADLQFSFAVVRAIQIVGEAAAAISKETRDSIPGLPWPSIVAMRNWLVHAYFDINHDRVWDTIESDLPQLVAALRNALGDLGNGTA